MRLPTICIVTTLLALCHCTSKDKSGSQSLGSMSLLMTVPPATSAARVLALADNANTTLMIDKVEVVVREMRFQQVDGVGDCSESSGASRADGSIDDRGCAEFHAKPKVVSLALDANGTTQVSQSVPNGSYRRLVFKVHKLDDDDADDRVLLQERPELKKVSIRATGTFQGSPYTYVTDLQIKQRVEFAEPLKIDGQTPSTTTLTVDVNSWFKDASGNNIDPRTALKGGANDKRVESAIESSFGGFGGISGGGGGGGGGGRGRDDEGEDDRGGKGGDDPAGDDKGGSRDD